MGAVVKKQHSTYNANQRSEESVRETEARALLSCANKLEQARNPNCSNEEFVNAVRHNQQLWTLFQAFLCDPENPLPDDLKITLLNISRYVDKASFKAIGEGNKEILAGLIHINRTIAAGLAKKPERTAVKETQEQPVPSTSPITTTA